MATLPYCIVDVFTDTPLAGNPLAVFTVALGLESATMQAIAREMNLSETTFVLPAQSGGDARVRIFTPRAEIPFAGHPTLGTAVVLAEARSDQTVQQIVLELPVGQVPVDFDAIEPPHARFGWFRRPTPRVLPFAQTHQLLKALGVSKTASPVGLYDNGMRHAVVQLDSPEALLALHPDLNALAHIEADTIDVFAMDHVEARLRVFAPAHGVSEDPATGSAAAPVREHLLTYSGFAPHATLSIRQGDHLFRPSRILVRGAQSTSSSLAMVEVGGSAVIVARGEFRLRS